MESGELLNQESTRQFTAYPLLQKMLQLSIIDNRDMFWKRGYALVGRRKIYRGEFTRKEEFYSYAFSIIMDYKEYLVLLEI